LTLLELAVHIQLYTTFNTSIHLQNPHLHLLVHLNQPMSKSATAAQHF